jgi:hypothetical protein
MDVNCQSKSGIIKLTRHNNELLKTQIEQILALIDVSVKNLQDFGMELTTPKDSRLYAMKGAALMLSEFDEILFLDADNIPARDPSFLFESDPFKETGALFWKDYWTTRCDNPILQILDLGCLHENEQESGQLVIKKSSPGIFKALSLAFYMQRKTSHFGNFILGDKDTFRLSWRYLNVPYHMVFIY